MNKQTVFNKLTAHFQDMRVSDIIVMVAMSTLTIAVGVAVIIFL